MAEYIVTDQELEATANAIREKGGTTTPLEWKSATGFRDGVNGLNTGAVDSVNGQTGAVVLDAEDVGALPDDTTAADLGAYVMPSGGIPKSDLDSDVQAALDGGVRFDVTQSLDGTERWRARSNIGAAATTDVPTAGSATPQPLGTAAAGSNTAYSRSDHVHQLPTAADVGAAPAVTEVTISTAGAVTQALDAGKIYHFTGALTSLTVTLNAAASGQLAQYHFDFESGSTAATVTITGVTWPDGSFTPEANKRYEVDILNGYAVVMAWEVS